MGRNNRHSPSNSIQHRPPPLNLDAPTNSIAVRRCAAVPFIVEPISKNNNNSTHRSTSAFPPPLSLRLPTREESTRVQLQRQRLDEDHATLVVSQCLPGLKTSTAFFTSLRTNLASPPPSPLPTPTIVRSSIFRPPPSPLIVQSTMSTPTPIAVPVEDDPLAGVPELNSYITTSTTERLAALRLIADSIAQMRQTANSALLAHPLNLSIALPLLAALAQYVYKRTHDLTLVCTTIGGILAVLLLTARWLTQDLLHAAERLDTPWLDANADELFVTRFGDEVIAALALKWVPAASNGGRKKKAFLGEIRAWTVRLKYRGKGVGAALLEEAVREARKKGAETVVFAEVVAGSAEGDGEDGASDGHANSVRVLPAFYNGVFDKREKRARLALDEALATSPTKKGRKRGSSS